MTPSKIGGRAALTDQDRKIIKSDPLLARLYQIEAPHLVLPTLEPAEAEPVFTPPPAKAKPVSVSPNERKIRAQKIREQAARARAQPEQFKAVDRKMRVIERSLFSMRMAGASPKDVATFLRLAADQLERDE